MNEADFLQVCISRKQKIKLVRKIEKRSLAVGALVQEILEEASC